MKKTSILFGIIAVLAFAVSCESKIDIQDNPVESQAEQITITATLSDVLTKVAFTPGVDGSGKPIMELAWESGDKLLVADHANPGSYSEFTLDASCIGQKTGFFTGTPVSASSYDVSVAHGNVAYNAQTQAADGDYSHLTYIASASEVTDLSSIEFTDISSVLALRAKLPSDIAATVKTIVLTSSSAIFAGGNTMTITLTSAGVSGGDDILDVYATLKPGNVEIPENSTLVVSFNTTDSKSITRYHKFVSATQFKASNYNSLQLKCASYTNTFNDCVLVGNGTSNNPYEIGDKYQMQAMHSLLVDDATIYFTMVDEVDLDGVDWVALNNAGSYQKGIYFDGDGHTISNLTCSTGAYPSFVGVVNGTVKDVTFDHAAITAGGKTSGVLAGYVGSTSAERTGNISGITVKNSSVTGATKVRVGGIAGYVNLAGSTISDCHVINTTIESSSEKVGGLFGEVGTFTIDGCSATNVSVSGAGGNGAGGLVGNLGGGVIQNCEASGTVTGVSACGGLVGYLVSGTVSGNTSSVNVSNTTFYAGSLIGRMIAGSVTNCSASGNVTNTRANYAHAGGLIGTVEGGSIEKCHATGNVTSTASSVGGLIGSITKDLGVGTVSISRCYATGNVTESNETLGKQNYGGLVGYIGAGCTVTIADCYSTGSVSAAKYSGGFLGNIDDSSVTITNGYTTSAVSGAKWNCCVFVGAYKGALDEKLHCTGFVGWNTSNRVAWSYSNNQAIHPGCYMGTEGSVYAQAVALGGWDFVNVWTTDTTPQLR